MTDDDDDDITQAEKDDVTGVAVAVLQASLRGDMAGAEMALEGVNQQDLLALMFGMHTRVAVAAYGGPERYSAVLAAWRPGTRLGEAFEDGPVVGPDDDLDRFPDAQELWDQMARLDRVRLEIVARRIDYRLRYEL